MGEAIRHVGYNGRNGACWRPRYDVAWDSDLFVEENEGGG